MGKCPVHTLPDGYRALAGGLHDKQGDLLLTGKNWFEALFGQFLIVPSSTFILQVPDWASRCARLKGQLANSEVGRAEAAWGLRVGFLAVRASSRPVAVYPDTGKLLHSRNGLRQNWRGD